MSLPTLTPAQRDRLRDEWNDRCFYCEMPLGPQFEADHFPWPRAVGGEELVPACLNCHDRKDRYPLASWPPEEIIRAMRELTPEGRILLAKLMRIMAAASLIVKMPLGQLELMGREITN